MHNIKWALAVILTLLTFYTAPSFALEKTAAKTAITPVAATQGSKIDLNSASLSDLTTLKGIGEKKAQAIINYREKVGKFTSVEQLAEVTGIGPATVEANRDLMIVK